MGKEKYSICIKLYFESGDPKNICEVYMDNFNGKVHKIPRAYIYEKKLEKEIAIPGVYFLIGVNNGEHRLYIGESEDVWIRIKRHEKEQNKSWFSDVIVITSEQKYLNKAKIKYLENMYHKMATTTAKCSLEQTIPTKSSLSKTDKGPLMEFINKTKMMISALGYNFFEEIERLDKPEEPLYFYFKKSTENEAVGYRVKDGFVICKKSYVNPKEVPSLYKWIKESRSKYKDKIVNNKLIENVLFNSSSFAAGFITGSSRNGNEIWLTEEGIKLGEYLESMKEDQKMRPITEKEINSLFKNI